MVIKERTAGNETKVTPRSIDYSQWYLDVIGAADLAEYGPTRGTMIIKPLGYALWERVQRLLDEKIKDHGVQNVYFPMLIPERLLKKEESHVEGFSPEVAVVTYAGGAKLEEALIVRPTSETIMYDTFSRWVQSHRDLPILINQWANVVRWEMRPRLFLRTTEFLWQEGHTAHSTVDEADGFAREMLSMYATFARDVMAIPVIEGAKSDSEKFAGAVCTYCLEAMMQDGKALQYATSHNLGQNFAKAFGIEFTTEDNKTDFVWQTSWGLSTRTIGGLIMTHSDDRGLVLPPAMAPVKVTIIPFARVENTRDEVMAAVEKLHDELVARFGNDAVVIDDRDITPGAKHFYWEKRGTPIRLELGKREVDSGEVVAICRDTCEKQKIARTDIVVSIDDMLSDIQKRLYNNALARRIERTVVVDNMMDFEKAIEDGKFVMVPWGGEATDESLIKEKTKATIRCFPFEGNDYIGKKCFFTGKDARSMAFFARSY